MERSMEIKLVSARDLNNVNLLTKMDVYAVVNLLPAATDNSDQKFKSPVDIHGGCNPTWNFFVKFKIDEAAARANRLTLVFKLRCCRNLGDRDVGQVYVPVKELLDSAGDIDGDLMQHVSYQVRKPSGNPQGVLNFSFKFGDYLPSGSVKPSTVHSYKPVSAYPEPSSYEPAQSLPMYGYDHLPPPPYTAAYGYPPSYYPPPAQKKKSNTGLGLGAGLVGGM